MCEHPGRSICTRRLRPVRVVHWLPVAVIALLLSACGGTSTPAARHATPERIVALFIAALDAHDKAAARPLLTPTFARYALDQSGSWFNDSLKITRLRTSKPWSESAAARSQGYKYGKVVNARFVIEPLHSGATPKEVSVENFYLMANSTNGPWLIGAEGNSRRPG
jgi:hypothetical protein